MDPRLPLHAVEQPATITGMKTYYKPSQFRGKRLIYVTTDPAESKKQTAIALIFVSIIVLGGVIFWLSK